MKKLFTIDDIMVAFVAAMGYGYGDTLSRLFSWPEPACIAGCLVMGMASEWIVNRIVFSERVQKSPRNRMIAYTACFLVFLVGQILSFVFIGKSMFEYLGEQFLYVIGMPIAGFLINLAIRRFRIRKIRERYGDGSEGYVFDLKQEDIAEANRGNQPAAGDDDDGCTVRTRTGVYVGKKEKKTVSFLGIPYAQPPEGRLRWKAPEPLPASEAVFEAKHFGASAVQVEHQGSIVKHHRQSEDCLTLNICTGEKKTESGKPVLVLFHHGDFTCGGAVDPLLYGVDFAAAHPDVVFVSFNYRLGIFGFIDFSKVPGGQVCPDTLNLGLLDQIAALKWIRENIAAFGGDPEQITVLGFESGATSILLLAAGGQAKGLFRKAFVFNGSPVSAYDTPEASQHLAEALLKETRTSTMAELLQLDTNTLKDAAQRLWGKLCAPACDGNLVPADVYQAFRDGAASDIGFIIGLPGHTAQEFRPLIGSAKYGELLSLAAADLRKPMDGSAAGTQREAADARPASPDALEGNAKLVERGLALSVYHTAATLAEGGSRVHLLYWDEKPIIENLGSGTVDAAAALLGNGEAQQMYGSVMNADLSEILQALLLKFMSGKDLALYPNEIKGVDALEWKAFPRALVVSDGELQCSGIEDRLL